MEGSEVAMTDEEIFNSKINRLMIRSMIRLRIMRNTPSGAINHKMLRTRRSVYSFANNWMAA